MSDTGTNYSNLRGYRWRGGRGGGELNETDIVQVERVANGYLVRVPAHRTGGGVVAGERVYIAAAPRDVATILEEEVFVEREEEPEVDPPTAPTVEELASAGLVRRGTDVAAAEE
ncbi:MAG TPA: hypothetical protein PKD75_13885 [Tepidiformaceae bacterium]|nr:hypothetical protein [Tepidiformaceae bacterium]